MSLGFTFFLKGVALGFGSGIAPGPLTMLVVIQTLKYGWKEGLKVAIVPILTDFPIIALSYGVLTYYSHVDGLIAAVCFIGAVVLLKMAHENWKAQAPEIGAAQISQANPGSLKKGLLLNFMSPYPYLFWITVGTPIIISATHEDLSTAVAFVVGMFTLMVGVKMSLALIARRSLGHLKGRAFVTLLRILAVGLVFFSGAFVLEGLGRVGVFQGF